MPKAPEKYRHWAVTRMNDTDLVAFREQCERAKAEAFCAQVERCPSTSTLHI